MSKVQIKRPFFILFVALNYALAPVVHYFFIRHMESAFEFNSWQVFGSYQLYFSLPLLLSMPLVAVCLYLLRRWGFIIFIVHSVLVLGDNVYRSVYYPKLYSYVMLVVSTVLIFAVIGLITKHFRSPYLQILKRNRRENERLPIYHSGLVNDQVFGIVDLSAGGCYIESTQHNFLLDDPVVIDFNSENLVIHAHGRVLRIDERGFGIKFKALSPLEKQSIRHLIENRFELRYKLEIFCRIKKNDNRENNSQENDNDCEANLLNISRNGCYIVFQELEKFHQDQSIQLVCEYFTINGYVSWLNDKAEYKKPVGFGMRFNKKVRNVVSLLKNNQLPVETTR